MFCFTVKCITEHLSGITGHFSIGEFLYLCKSKNNKEMKNTAYGLLVFAFCCLLIACKPSASKSEDKATEVEVLEVGKSLRNSGYSYSGTIEEETGCSLGFAVAGTVSEVLVKEGDKVSKGELLASLDKSNARNAYDIAVATEYRAKDAYERVKLLHEQNSVSEIQWIEAESKYRQATAQTAIAMRNLQDCNLRAPFSGVISRRNIEQGQNLLPTESAFRLVKINKVKVVAAVPENEITNIKIGQAVSFVCPALDNKVFNVRITEKGIRANALTRSYTVKALVNNESMELLPGMVCSMDIPHNDTIACIYLPVRCIMTDERNRNFVWLNENGRARKQYVELGKRNTGDLISISDGLKEKQRVIVGGCMKVSEGMVVREKK